MPRPGPEEIDAPAMRAIANAALDADGCRAYGAGEADCAALIQHLADGAILLDADGRVFGLNAAAERLCRPARGLAIRDGRLRAAAPVADGALQLMIGRAAGRYVGGAATGREELRVEDVAGERPLLVQAGALRIEPANDGARRAAAVVFVVDLAARPQVPPERLAALYRLTAAEADLACRLAAGASLEEAARETGRAIGTLRSHLKRVFLKTDTRRQADLVRLLVRLAERR